MRKPTLEEKENNSAAFLLEVGKRVKLMREANGISRREMTDKANLKPAYGLMIEMEGQNFTIKSLNNIAIALGCDARDLMPNPAEERAQSISAKLSSDNRVLWDLIEKQQTHIQELYQTAALIRESMVIRFGDSD